MRDYIGYAGLAAAGLGLLGYLWPSLKGLVGKLRFLKPAVVAQDTRLAKVSGILQAYDILVASGQTAQANSLIDSIPAALKAK